MEVYFIKFTFTSSYVKEVKIDDYNGQHYIKFLDGSEGTWLYSDIEYFEKVFIAECDIPPSSYTYIM